MIKKSKWLLIVLSFMLCILFVSCSGEAPASSTDGTTSDDTSSSEPTIETKAPLNLVYKEETVLSENGISIPSASYISGTLLSIDEENLYRYNLPSLVPSDSVSGSVSRIQAQNLMKLFGNKSQNYSLTVSHLFMRADAFGPWEELIDAFVLDTGKTSIQVVSAYVYSGEESLKSSFVTGYSVAINLYENGVTYSLASPEKSVTVNGETMTCLDWFQDNCAKYGFVYTGLDGNQSRTLATFRFVGIPHALAMQQHDYIDTAEYTNFIRSYPSIYTVADSRTGVTWNIGYYPTDLDKTTTVIDIPVGAVYTISGNNSDGFIVAYYMP